MRADPYIERQFGGTVGGVFLAVGLWMLWRTAVSAAVAGGIAAAGALLLVLAFIAPRALVRPRRAWMALAEALGYVTTRLILALVFFLAVTPIGWSKRVAGWDPLTRRRARPDESYWRPFSARQHDAAHLEKMF